MIDFSTLAIQLFIGITFFGVTTTLGLLYLLSVDKKSNLKIEQ